MEAVDSSMTVMGALAVDNVAHRANASRNEETANNSLDRLDNANGIEAAKDENVRDDAESADTVCAEDSTDSADVTDSRSMEIDDKAKGDSNDCESDGDSTNEETCLEAMTPDVQNYYLRLGDTPRRRSALRLSRIIARQQLLRRLSQGRTRESYGKVIMCSSAWFDLVSQCLFI